jgi:hypothetical protein
MADFTIGINVRDNEINITIAIDEKVVETFTIDEAERFHDVLGHQINLAKSLTHSESAASGFPR